MHRPHRGTGNGERPRGAVQVGGQGMDQPLVIEEPAEHPSVGQQPEHRSQQRRRRTSGCGPTLRGDRRDPGYAGGQVAAGGQGQRHHPDLVAELAAGGCLARGHRHRHRHQAELLAAAGQQDPQRPGDDGQDHVVDGAAVGMAQLADRGQIGGDDIEPPPPRPGGAVQRRPREPARPTGAAQLGQALPDRAHAARRVGERRARPAQASAASARARGAGAGKPAAAGLPGGTPGPSSTSLASTASPPMPSASTWFMTTTRPVPPSARPVTNVADHSGRDRGSGSRISAAATSNSARSSPGGRHDRCRMWCRRSNAGSSAQNGRPQPGGARHSRCRSRGTA